MKYTVIKTTDIAALRPFLDTLVIPKAASHKGQNGRALIIGGSRLFHAASLWAAETASHFVDITHYSSTVENNAVFLALKKQFRNGIIVEHKDIPWYINEDDAILIGPGMVRGEFDKSHMPENQTFADILNLSDEALFSRAITNYLLTNFPAKKFVLDAGALQMMDPAWLLLMKEKPIITPHQLEFEKLFSTEIVSLSVDEKVKLVQETASQYNCVILLKAVIDIISDGTNTYVIEGGNQGLTKGGTGDTLAGLVLSFFAKTDALTSAVMASYVLKKTSDDLSQTHGYWYNVENLIEKIPTILKNILYN